MGSLPVGYSCPPGGNNVTREHGQAWATMINELKDYCYLIGYDKKIIMAGAIDIEPAWNYASDTRAWIDGYDSTTTIPVYNFGSCDGCPTFDNPDSVPSGPPGFDNTWALADVFYVSWEASSARVLPQIYAEDGSQAQQWYLLKVWGLDQGKGPMHISGALTQHTACSQRGGCTNTNNAPDAGWVQLWRALNDTTYHIQQGSAYVPAAAQELIPNTGE